MEHTHSLLTLEAIERLLIARQDNRFLTLRDLPDPYAFKDMDRATQRIIRAIRNNEKILLVGDYDVDGVSATAIMRRFFQTIGVDLEWVIPNRFRDGYGLSPTLFPRLKHADLIVTVDNGIRATEAADLCREAGIDLIITDHHIVPEKLPAAYAVVDQKQPECSFPYEEVCGAQIAWYLCAALNRELGTGVDMKALLELSALAIIADIMPLRHINRSMVRQGLKLLERSESPFAVVWREATGKDEFRAEDLAFGLAPLLNSAGRMEDAAHACEFLCAGTTDEARRLLLRLQGYNERRKSLERDIAQEAARQVRGDESVLVLTGEEWHEGVLGIVAARIARRFERPTLVLTRNGDFYKGSGRSFGDCDLFDLVERHSPLLEKFGGHRAAVGLSLEAARLERFEKALQNAARERCPQEPFRDPDILGELPLSLVGWELYRLLERFEPYGEGNPRPKFISRNLEILEHRALGGGAHHKYLLSDGRESVEAIQFRSEIHFLPGERIDLLYTLGSNRFNGRTTLQLMVEKIDGK